MLTDGVVKRFPTAFVKINTPFYKHTVKGLCMETPVQELIVGNILEETGVEACYEVEVTQQNEVISDEHEIECETQPTQIKNEETKKTRMRAMPNVVVALPNIGGDL